MSVPQSWVVSPHVQMSRQALQQQPPMAKQSQNLAPEIQVMLHSPVSPEVGLGVLEPWVRAALS